MHGNILIDTNVLMSVLLKQNDYQTSRKFFNKLDEFNISYTILDFSIYSACVILNRRNKEELLEKFIENIKKKNNINIYRLKLENLLEIAKVKNKLDFDDKIHYYLAKKKNLTLISYDADFDKTDLKRLTPLEAIKTLELS